MENKQVNNDRAVATTRVASDRQVDDTTGEWQKTNHLQVVIGHGGGEVPR